MRTTVALTHLQGLHCEARLANGSVLSIDPGMQARADRGPSPLELMALAHGACMAMMMVKAGKELGLDLSTMQVEIEHEFGEGAPMKMSQARLRFTLPCAITPEQEHRLRQGAEGCPVHSALRPEIPVTFELVTRSHGVTP